MYKRQVLPVLHLNGYKIANPTVLARSTDDELSALMTGYGSKPYLVAGDNPVEVHQLLAATLDTVFDEIAEIQRAARDDDDTERPRWPMIVLKTPKGWTGPKEVDGRRMEGSWRSHQVPFADARGNDAHRAVLDGWMRSYKPEELFGADGAPVPDVADLHPAGERRMSANPHANGTWWDRQLPSIRLPSTSLGPVQPFGERSTIIGQGRRAAVFFRLPRASCWMSRISSRQWSRVAANAWCISAGSEPETTYGAWP